MESTRLVVLRGSEACYSIVRPWAKATPWSSVRSFNNIRHPSVFNREIHSVVFESRISKNPGPQYLFSKRELRFHGTHNHGHNHNGDDHVHVDLATTIRNSSKQGMRITVIGMAANIGLTVSKGLAGWMMNSASLLADAAHSFSGKYETVGTLAVSSLLIVGACGIGIHSFELLMTALNISGVDVAIQSASVAMTTTTETNSAKDVLTNSLHSHSNDGVLDPNAAWFALASVIIKEWLYRATIKVGEVERSDVLIANAWHHRSDAYSSMVALVAIGGSYAGLPVLDPLGGLLVAGMILKSEQDLIDFHSIRGRKMGPFHHLDLVLQLNPQLTISQAHRIEQLVRHTIKTECKLIQEVLVHLDAEKQPPHH
ncbi:hypothetical protein CLU79DRAFT_697643 [Phycomyces nitens]|nr:hypothetical protein CLU79DRAFT_697643 [Phycomyces nitens]